MPKRKQKKTTERYKIVNIRGANGCGKSHIVRELIKETNARPIYADDEPNRLLGGVVGYVGDYDGTPIYFVGSYVMMSGGADHIMKHYGGIAYVDKLIRKFHEKGIVVFEGFIISGLFQRFYDLSQELGGIVWCYMDTPLKVCYERIDERNTNRSAAMSGRVRKARGSRHVHQKYEETERTKKKFIDAGEKVVIINHKKPMRDIHKILRGEM